MERTFIQRTGQHVAIHGALPRFIVDHPLASGEMFSHGAHVTEWQPAGHQPVLFISPSSDFQPGKAIRGGVPICFPWFGPHAQDANLPSHGFARTLPWTPIQSLSDADGVKIHMQLRNQIADPSKRGNDFVVDYHVSFGTVLEMKMIVTNQGSQPFDFEAALHAYYKVSDIHQISITGLQNAEYISKSEGGQRKTQTDELIRFTSETDRMYLNTTSNCVIEDPGMNRRITVEKRGSNSTVVWNPFEKRATELTDIGPGNWQKFVCIETANVNENLIQLAPGAKHEMIARVSVSRI